MAKQALYYNLCSYDKNYIFCSQFKTIEIIKWYKKERLAHDFRTAKNNFDFIYNLLLKFIFQGIDLKAEMAKKLKEIEELFLKEKEEANQAFQQERKVKISFMNRWE